MKKVLFVLIALLCCIPSWVFAQQKSDKIVPSWIKKGVPKATAAHIFESTFGQGASLDAARQKCFINLTTKLEHERGIVVKSSFRGESHFDRESGYKLQNDFSMECEENGKNISMICKAVDEYWEKSKDGTNSCHILYSIANLNGSGYDSIAISSNYISDPANWGLMLIPGAAQMYKGSYLKGGLIMGGAVLFAGGIITFESMRADYVKKIATTHSADVKKAYNDRANNMATARNICIGGVAALYVYNIIDALVAPGARRVIVTPSATVNGPYGMALRYNF